MGRGFWSLPSIYCPFLAVVSAARTVLNVAATGLGVGVSRHLARPAPLEVWKTLAGDEFTTLQFTPPPHIERKMFFLGFGVAVISASFTYFNFTLSPEYIS